jgi:hypothetical protein
MMVNGIIASLSVNSFKNHAGTSEEMHFHICNFDEKEK